MRCWTGLVYRVILAVFFSNWEKYFMFLWFVFKIIYSFKSQTAFKTFQWLPLTSFYVESPVQESFGVNFVT